MLVALYESDSECFLIACDIQQITNTLINRNWVFVQRLCLELLIAKLAYTEEQQARRSNLWAQQEKFSLSVVSLNRVIQPTPQEYKTFWN